MNCVTLESQVRHAGVIVIKSALILAKFSSCQAHQFDYLFGSNVPQQLFNIMNGRLGQVDVFPKDFRPDMEVLRFNQDTV